MNLLGPVIAGALVIIGLLGGDPVTFLLGVAYALYFYYTRPTRYEVYNDRLVVRYGRPRQKNLLLADVEEVRLVKLPMGREAIWVQKKGGRGELIRPADPERFLAQLEDALHRLGR